jgi:hypothetical protein
MRTTSADKRHTVMLKFVALPTRAGERDLLAGNEHEPLLLRDLSHTNVLRIDPTGKWSHKTLVAVLKRADVLTFVHENFGADAYLGGQWIGGSEV